jgi:chondroitin 4-sulfotransferase 11
LIKIFGIKFKYYVIIPEKKLIYLINYKVASSSILSTLIAKKVIDNEEIHTIAKQVLLQKLILNKRERKYYKFTFVRNPYTRLISCYKNKILNEKDKKRPYFKQNLFKQILKSKSFDDFIKSVCKIPDRISDMHFISQYYYIYKGNNPIVDFVGKFETLQKDFKYIKDKFNLESLPHCNKTSKSDWMNNYTLETAELVYNRYKNDFKAFGYEKEYKRLINYLRCK